MGGFCFKTGTIEINTDVGALLCLGEKLFIQWQCCSDTVVKFYWPLEKNLDGAVDMLNARAEVGSVATW